MLRVAIIDANERPRADEAFIGDVVSVVGHWLSWECEQVGIVPCAPHEADILFVVHAGLVNWRQEVARFLRKFGVEPDAERRGRRPYIVAGGAVDAAPFTALRIADSLSVGEAYRFVRGLLCVVVAGGTVDDIVQYASDHPHAIERAQIAKLQRAPDAPYMLAEVPPVLATPDGEIDWNANAMIRSVDGTLRIIASKGCRLKCKFCATTYRQTYQVNPHEGQLLGAINTATLRGERLMLITNDAAALPIFSEAQCRGKLAAQSMTIKAVRNPAVRQALYRSRVGIVRFGIEGISERIRQAFGKPIRNDELLDILLEIHEHNQRTHLFFIVGAPYETDEDWAEFRDFHVRLTHAIKRQICKIKFTAFNPQAPAPLSYFIPDSRYLARFKAYNDFESRNYASRHLFLIKPRHPASQLQDLADGFDVPKAWLRQIYGERTVDLAPELEYAQRMTWEVVGWPLSVEKRWGLSRLYMKRLGIGTPQVRGFQG